MTDWFARGTSTVKSEVSLEILADSSVCALLVDSGSLEAVGHLPRRWLATLPYPATCSSDGRGPDRATWHSQFSCINYSILTMSARGFIFAISTRDTARGLGYHRQDDREASHRTPLRTALPASRRSPVIPPLHLLSSPPLPPGAAQPLAVTFHILLPLVLLSGAAFSRPDVLPPCRWPLLRHPCLRATPGTPPGGC